MRKAIIPAAIMLGITTFGINEYNNYQNEQLIDRIRKSEYNPQTMIEVKLEEIRKQEEMDKKIQEQIEELVEYIGSDEYKLREETRSWREELGISIDEIKPVTFKTTAYSSLAEENGGFMTTCWGEPLEGNIVANNTLPQGTKIYLDGEIYTVNDRGSSRFDNPNRIDMLIERNPVETDVAYKKRVSDFGVQYIEGYIIKE